MIFHRFEEEGLAHYSYVVADERSGEAVVVDPRRDADVYVDWIEAQDLKLTAVLETHIHADYASGSHELATRKEVPHYLGDYDDGERYEAQYDHEPLVEGDRVEIGSLTFEVLHTPGHTPEHISYLLFEGDPHSAPPVRMFSGDFLFVGSLGRPDLLGEGETNRLVNMLYDSVRRIDDMDLPDELMIHPAHGAGSLCGAGLGDSPSSTLGEEKQNNRYFRMEDRDEFVTEVQEALGTFPPYYRRMKETNSVGAPFVQPISAPDAIGIDDFLDVTNREDSLLVDLRDPGDFGAGHIPSSYNLGFDPGLNKWGPWVLPYEQPIYFIGDNDMDETNYEEAYRILMRVELDEVVGYLDGGFPAWQSAEQPTQTLHQYDAEELQRRLEEPGEDPLVLDVRTESEYDEEHIPGSRWLMVGELPDRLRELPSDSARPIVTVCGSGYRSSLAGSLLLEAGYENVGHLVGGFPAWVEASSTRTEVQV